MWRAVCVLVVFAVVDASSSFAGLRNAGATCYLNSVLQTLYHVPLVREAARKAALEDVCVKKKKRRLIPRRPGWLGGSGDPTTVPKAVGAVFERLGRNATGGTRELTRALGVAVWEQQDAQEYLRLVLEELGSKAPDARRAYEGELESFLELTAEEAERVGEPFARVRKETFLDLSLEVAGHSDVGSSLEAFLTPEKLQGDNKWRAGEHGLCEATKGVRLSKLPPVLLLHLKRFGYDPQRDAVAKMGHPLTFPLDLDLSKHLAESNDSLYVLHAVVVHVGGGSAGHYFAYVDPRCDGRWLRFDDDRVTSVGVERVLRDGTGLPLGPGHSMGAYLLQYVRKSDINHLLSDQHDDNEEASSSSE